jgi:hypothetical protein
MIDYLTIAPVHDLKLFDIKDTVKISSTPVWEWKFRIMQT